MDAQCGRVVVSTDSKELSKIAVSFGAEVPFLRPLELSTDKAASLSVIIHALLWLKNQEKWVPDMLMFRPPTNPFIRPVTIKNMFHKLEETPSANSIVTITKPKTHPFRLVELCQDGKIKNGIISIEGKTINDIERSQDWPIVWEGSPACRLSRSKYFMKQMKEQTNLNIFSGKTYDVDNCFGYNVDDIEAFDIDDSKDFKLAELLYLEYKNFLFNSF